MGHKHSLPLFYPYSFNSVFKFQFRTLYRLWLGISFYSGVKCILLNHFNGEDLLAEENKKNMDSQYYSDSKYSKYHVILSEEQESGILKAIDRQLFVEDPIKDVSHLSLSTSYNSETSPTHHCQHRNSSLSSWIGKTGCHECCNNPD
ncbi:Kinesin-IIsubunit [Dirofilaria immitis]